MIEKSLAVALQTLITLQENGIEKIIVCPGSRSAPLAIAAHALWADSLIVETDERVAGFLALGMGKAGHPCAVVVTSGSAVANLHPAVEEAAYSGVPLVVVSADRPAELRGVQASQTTNNLAVLAGSVRDSREVSGDFPQLRAVANQVRRLAQVAIGQAYGILAGPVHLNVVLREPLDTRFSDEEIREYAKSLTKGNGKEFSGRPLREQTAKTVIVAGPSTVFTDLESELAQIVVEANLPILAEPSSIFWACSQAMPSHPLLLSAPLGADIERVIVLGHPTLTREVATLLANPELEVIAVAENPTYTDVSGNADQVIMPEQLGQWLDTDLTWLAAWQHLALQVRRQINQYFGTPRVLDYAGVAFALGKAMQNYPVDTFLAASSIVREVNLYAPVGTRAYLANRGLAGIDGNVSTACGVALATGAPTRVVVGDLAFLHDLGALVTLVEQARQMSSAPLRLQVVVIDDGGGSLFSTLEYGAGPLDRFARVFQAKRDFPIADFLRALEQQIKVQEFVGDVWQLQELLREEIVGVEVLYVSLSAKSLPEMRENRAALRAELLSLWSHSNSQEFSS